MAGGLAGVGGICCPGRAVSQARVNPSLLSPAITLSRTVQKCTRMSVAAAGRNGSVITLATTKQRTFTNDLLLKRRSTLAVLKILLGARSPRGRELRNGVAAAALVELLPGGSRRVSSAANTADPLVRRRGMRPFASSGLGTHLLMCCTRASPA